MATMNGHFLSIESIIEATGEEHLEDVTDLEILFTSCGEIDSLQYCPNLIRLSMINNGLIAISNLHPVQHTLVHLCLCDQQIYRMENLYLPQLECLYLHRNNIEEITGLEHCTQLKVLWLNQNRIHFLSGLENCPSLEELQLNDNQISTLHGIQAVQSSLRVLGLANNFISDFEELDILQSMINLKEVFFYDVHFGACPVYELEGYREYVIISFPGLTAIDGVRITSARAAAAREILQGHANAIQAQLEEVDAQYTAEMAKVREIESAQIESFNQAEEARRSELNDLATRLATTMQSIEKETRTSEAMFEQKLSDFHAHVDQLLEDARDALQTQLMETQREYDRAAGLVCTLEYVESIHDAVSHSFESILDKSGSNNNIQFETVATHTNEFRKVAEAFSYHRDSKRGSLNESIPVGFQKKLSHHGHSTSVSIENGASCQIELARLYQIHSEQNVDKSRVNAFTVLSLKQLETVLLVYNESIQQANLQPPLKSHLDDLGSVSFTLFSNPGMLSIIITAFLWLIISYSLIYLDLAVSSATSSTKLIDLPKPDAARYWKSLQVSSEVHYGVRITNDTRTTEGPGLVPVDAPHLLAASKREALILLWSVTFIARNSSHHLLLNVFFQYCFSCEVEPTILEAQKDNLWQRTFTPLHFLAAIQSNAIIPHFVAIALTPILSEGGFAWIEKNIESAMTRLRALDK